MISDLSKIKKLAKQEAKKAVAGGSDKEKCAKRDLQKNKLKKITSKVKADQKISKAKAKAKAKVAKAKAKGAAQTAGEKSKLAKKVSAVEAKADARVQAAN